MITVNKYKRKRNAHVNVSIVLLHVITVMVVDIDLTLRFLCTIYQYVDVGLITNINLWNFLYHLREPGFLPVPYREFKCNNAIPPTDEDWKVGRIEVCCVQVIRLCIIMPSDKTVAAGNA